jgi:hypothetical protein
MFKVISYTFKIGFICNHQKETITTAATTAAATNATTFITAAAAAANTTANAVNSTLKRTECTNTVIPDVMELCRVKGVVL